MPSQKKSEPASSSIDDFIGEIEKAEAEPPSKRLPQEPLKHKRALDPAHPVSHREAGES